MADALPPSSTGRPAPHTPPATGPDASATAAVRPRGRDAPVRRWYENELGWPTVPGSPVRLAVGVRFDVLDVPAEAGLAALRRLAPGSPVALRGDRMRLLVAAGSAEEVPGLLEWLEWGAGALGLDLAVRGAGDALTAPLPPGMAPARRAADVTGDGAGPAGGTAGCGGSAGAGVPAGGGGPGISQGAAVWLRPPEPGGEVEASLPTLSALGGGGAAPDLVRLVDTVAAQCHRVRLRRACTRPPAWYA